MQKLRKDDALNDGSSEVVDEIIETFPKAWKEYYGEQQRWQSKSNSASQLGHDCERFLTYKRTCSDKEELFSSDVLALLKEGKRQEKAVKLDLLEMGFEVIHDQYRYEDPAHQISGKIDGKISAYREKVFRPAIPFDTKTMDSNVYKRINSQEDFNRYAWTKKYISQLQLYLIMDNIATGMFILKDRSFGGIKLIKVNLDLEHVEELYQKATRINKHVAEGTLPDRIPYTEDGCGRCSFKTHCEPDENFAGAHLEDAPETVIKLERLEELKPSIKEYQDIEKEIKEHYKTRCSDQENGEKFVIGGKYLIKGDYRSRTTKPSEGGTSYFWQVGIKPITDKVKI